MSDDDLARLATQRRVIDRYIPDDEESQRKYETTAGKLSLLRELLQRGAFQATDTYELQCMGVVLGDALVLHLGLEWRAVDDEYGRDPAIQVTGTTLVLFPLTMISKRIERGEQVDVFELFNGIVGTVEELRTIVDKE